MSTAFCVKEKTLSWSRHSGYLVLTKLFNRALEILAKEMSERNEIKYTIRKWSRIFQVTRLFTSDPEVSLRKFLDTISNFKRRTDIKSTLHTVGKEISSWALEELDMIRMHCIDVCKLQRIKLSLKNMNRKSWFLALRISVITLECIFGNTPLTFYTFIMWSLPVSVTFLCI